jgi:hypothetical protein
MGQQLGGARKMPPKAGFGHAFSFIPLVSGPWPGLEDLIAAGGDPSKAIPAALPPACCKAVENSAQSTFCRMKSAKYRKSKKVYNKRLTGVRGGTYIAATEGRAVVQNGVRSGVNSYLNWLRRRWCPKGIPVEFSSAWYFGSLMLPCCLTLLLKERETQAACVLAV